jgi:E3 ubiquitin-protein ligase RFWD2
MNGGDAAGGGAAAATATAAAALFNPEDLACPICVETIEDAFATPCGHTFCFKCISTHLKNKSTCPSCSAHLVQDQIHPNFLLNKVTFEFKYCYIL